MKYEDFTETDLGERKYYEESGDVVRLPLTRDGFEALFERASKVYGLPTNDAQRSIMVGFIHHVERDNNEMMISVLAKCLHKAVANYTSWVINQEAKRRLAEADAAAQPVGMNEVQESISN